MREDTGFPIGRVFATVIGILGFSIIMGTVGCESVPPGYVGIKVYQYGNQKGVSDFPLKTGAVWYWRPTTDVKVFPIFTQRVIYDDAVGEGEPEGLKESIQCRSSQGAVINFDVGINFNLKSDRVPQIYITYRQDLQSLERTIIRDRLRGSFIVNCPKQTTAELIGIGQPKLEKDVLDDVQAKFEAMGIHVDTVQIVNKGRIDPALEASITQLLVAVQNTQTAQQKVAQVKAEADQLVAKTEGEKQARIAQAQGEAEANRLMNESINDRMLQLRAMEKWNGVLPVYMGGSAPLPFMTVGK
jgi:regulator of protease activity HflC (stomatin/prohibitin superfamily)